MADTADRQAGETELQAMQRRSRRIWSASETWRSGLSDIHEFILPYRTDTERSGGARAEYVNKIFDGTGVAAAFRFAPRAQADITPPFEKFFTLQAGPAVPQASRDDLERQLTTITAQIQGALDSSRWDTASLEMYADYFAGLGCMLIMPGPDREPVRFIPVPASQVALGMDPWGDVGSVIWKRSWPAEDLAAMWPDHRWSDTVSQQIRTEADKPVNVTQYTRADHATGRWRHMVMVENDGSFAQDDTFNTAPWLTPRFFVVPGDPMPRGPAHIALPFIKTANVTREFALKSAAFALLGLWMYQSDSVFDPHQAEFTPGKFWPVQSTGGNFGSSIARLPVPENFDISSIILEDERSQIKQATFDNQLPPDSGAVRSATEIVERMKADAQNWGGVPVRAQREIVHALVRRVADILYTKGALASQLPIDQFLLKVDVTSPMMRARRAQMVQPTIEWLSMLQGFGGAEFMALSANIEKIGTELGRAMGVPVEYLRSEADKSALQQAVAKMIAGGQQQPDAAAAPAGA